MSFSGSALGEYVTIVTGLPRSGTSLMMQMLAAGGLPTWTDTVRAADDDNPRGYFECERVKQLAHDNTWLMQAHGHAVKVVVPLLQFIGSGNYRVVFMRRNLQEVLRSQSAMLARNGKVGARLSPDQLAAVFQKQLQRAESHVQATGCDVVSVDYINCIENPAAVAQSVNALHKGRLQEAQMVLAIDPSLYRQRSVEA